MATEKDIVYVRHILLAIEKIGEYVTRGGKDLFDRDTAKHREKSQRFTNIHIKTSLGGKWLA